jgi:hypothetical protein
MQWRSGNMIEPNEPFGHVERIKTAALGHKLSRGAALSLGSAALALLGVFGLHAATATSVPTALARTLPALAANWQEPTASAFHQVKASLIEHVSTQVVGDEGFWLSKRDLLGSAATSVTVGDQITFAHGPLTGPGTPIARDAAPHIYEVVELKTLRDGTFVTTTSPTTLGATDASVLTLVVGREVEPALGTAPRIVRFLIEGGTTTIPVSSARPRPTQGHSGAL